MVIRVKEIEFLLYHYIGKLKRKIKGREKATHGAASFFTLHSSLFTLQIFLAVAGGFLVVLVDHVGNTVWTVPFVHCLDALGQGAF